MDGSAKIVGVGDKRYALGWTDDYRGVNTNTSLDKEARKNPEAVFNRLVRYGNRDLADEIKDKYLH